MQLTPLQLEIQKYSRKELTFWCMVVMKGDHMPREEREWIKIIIEDAWPHFRIMDWETKRMLSTWLSDNMFDVIWHPVDTGELLYHWIKLETITGSDYQKLEALEATNKLFKYHEQHPEVLNKNILQWDHDFQFVAHRFLYTINRIQWTR